MIDLLIVGAGPCGLATAIAADRQGLKQRILDRGAITESLLHYPRYMTFFSTAERLEIGEVPFTIPEPKPTRREALAYYRYVAAHHRLSVEQYSEVQAIRRTHETFVAEVKTTRSETRRSIAARAITVATGGFGEPNYLDLESGPGIETGSRMDPSHESYARRIRHYYREPFEFFDQDVLVVGGGNSAVEAALDLYRNGVRVHMAHFESTFDPGVKPWVRPDIEQRIEAGEIRMFWRSRVQALGPDSVTLINEDTGDRTELPNQMVVAMTGWRPDHSLLLDLGVDVDSKMGIPAHDPTTMQTNIEGVYIAGVIAAGFNANKIFIENGRGHGELIARHLASR